MTGLDTTLRNAAAGDPSAWTELVKRYGGMLTAVGRSFRLTPHQIEDVAQDTWLQLFLHADQVRDPERVGAWLYRTMRNGCLRARQKQGREVPCGDWWNWTVPDPAPEIEAEMVRRERDEALRGAVGRLPARQRDLIRALLALETYAGVSAHLDIPVGAIGPTRARALERLRTEMIPSPRAGGKVLEAVTS